MPNAESRAREVFALLQSTVNQWQVDPVADLATDDATWIGVASYSRGREEFREYTRQVFDLNDSLQWDLETYDVFLDSADELGFSAQGAIVGTRDGVEQRLPFRVSVVAEKQDGAWKFRHFHGSVPMGAFTPVPVIE